MSEFIEQVKEAMLFARSIEKEGNLKEGWDQVAAAELLEDARADKAIRSKYLKERRGPGKLPSDTYDAAYARLYVLHMHRTRREAFDHMIKLGEVEIKDPGDYNSKFEAFCSAMKRRLSNLSRPQRKRGVRK